MNKGIRACYSTLVVTVNNLDIGIQKGNGSTDQWGGGGESLRGPQSSLVPQVIEKHKPPNGFVQLKTCMFVPLSLLFKRCIREQC